MPTKKFTPEQDAFLSRNADGMTVRAMADALGLPWLTVKHRLEALGLDPEPSNRPWTEADLDRLRDLAAKRKTLQEIADELNRTENAVRLKARKAGILTCQPGRKWTLEELETLREDWGKISMATIAKNVHRDVDAVAQQAHKMKLPPVYRNTDLMTLSEFCETSGISRDRVMRTLAPRHGFPVISRRYGKKRYNYYVDQEKVLEWLEEHQDLFDASLMRDPCFTPEPEWLRKKRAMDYHTKRKLHRTAKRRNWTQAEIEAAMSLYRNGYTADEIAERIHRSVGPVKAKLRENGMAWAGPKAWSGKDFEFLYRNWEAMTDKEIAAALGKTPKSVEHYRADLGLDKRESARKLAARRRTYIKKYWKRKTDEELAAKLGLSPGTVAHVRGCLGLRRK